MIDDRMYMLDFINLRLAALTDNINFDENVDKFRRSCHANRIKKTRYMMLISYIYGLNVALECLRNSVGNGIWPKDVTILLLSLMKGVLKFCTK